MSVSPAFRTYVLEQFARVTPVTSRSMFGGVGLYANGVFFALIDNDVVYLKVGASNRGRFEAAGSAQFHPYGDGRTMQYYELPADALEDVDALREWMDGAIDVALAARRNGR